ncbi:hypothetical protein R5R35_002927 [Gryllus longicercus]
MSKGEILADYKHEVDSLRKLGLEWNLTEEVIDKIIEDSFCHFTGAKRCERKSSSAVQNLQHHKRKCSVCIIMLELLCVFLMLSLCICLLLSFHKPSYNFAVRNVQELIYPSMKLLRWMALPFVRTFPSITVWYDELCLVQNPYFRPMDVNCWPCEDVRSILDLTGVENPPDYQPHSVFPYLVKGAATIVTYEELREMYFAYEKMLNRDSYSIQSSVPKWRTIADLMNHKLHENPSPNKDAHVVWRLNRLEPVRAIRELFPRPKFLLNSVNVERFIIIDEPETPQYTLPFPEGYKVFLMQGSGERLIILEPVEACAFNCSRVSVLLKPSYFLFYNSWFYRPKSSPVHDSTSIAITYIGSH